MVLARRIQQQQGVLDWHVWAVEEAKSKREAAMRARLAALKSSDMGAYQAMIRDTKNSRLQEMLQQTDDCLNELASKLKASGVNMMGPGGCCCILDPGVIRCIFMFAKKTKFNKALMSNDCDPLRAQRMSNRGRVARSTHIEHLFKCKHGVSACIRDGKKKVATSYML